MRNMEPDIVIPPLVGTAVLKNTLRHENLESFENLDCLARNQCEQNPGESMMDSRDEFTYEM